MTTQGMTQIITLKLPNQEDSQKLAFTVLNVFTDKECSEWIKVSEKHCYSPALLNIGIGEVSRPDIRNNDRKIWNGYKFVGLNERLRFLRYDPGQVFKGHMDGVYQRSDGSGERSFFTVQLYLNDNFEGGETTFLHYTDPDSNFPCKPQTGMALIFEHRIYHEGSILKKGRKYSVRTDVMYKLMGNEA